MECTHRLGQTPPDELAGSVKNTLVDPATSEIIFERLVVAVHQIGEQEILFWCHLMKFRAEFGLAFFSAHFDDFDLNATRALQSVQHMAHRLDNQFAILLIRADGIAGHFPGGL